MDSVLGIIDNKDAFVKYHHVHFMVIPAWARAQYYQTLLASTKAPPRAPLAPAGHNWKVVTGASPLAYFYLDGV
jgi:hypothetical protein